MPAAFGAKGLQLKLPTTRTHVRFWKTVGGTGLPLLFLDAPLELDFTNGASDRALLCCEAMRQALLMAAREGLAMSVRDAVLGELAPEGDPDASFDLETHFSSQRVRIALVRPGKTAGERDTLWERVIAVQKERLPSPTDLVTLAETLARNEFLKHLDDLGARGPKVEPKPGAVPDDRTLALIDRVEFLSTYHASRRLHDQARAGPSSQITGALVRAYVNLGILTEHHWSPAHKLFKARALLYAERLVSAEPKSAWGLWHRAYARALVGLHRDALADLEEAAKLTGADAVDKPPAWVELVDALCRYDTERLAAFPHRDHLGRLADLLRIRTVHEQLSTSLSCMRAPLVLPVLTAREVVSRNPEAYSVLDGVSQIGGVSALHWATTAGPETLDETLGERLREMPDLPKSTTAELARGGDEPRLCQSLLSADGDGDGIDRGEPTWATVAWLVRDARFCMVDRRLTFLTRLLDVSPEGELAANERLVADHPYRPYFQVYQPGPQTTEALKTLPVRDIELSEYPYIYSLYDRDRERFKDLFSRAAYHGEEIAPDLVGRCNHSLPEDIAGHARRLLEISPYNPTAMGCLIEYDWEFAEPHAAEWEATVGRQHPRVVGSLGRRYLELKRPEDAERCLRAFARLSPDRWVYELLAEQRLAMGDREGWRNALEEILQQEDTGLEHAQVRVEIARYYMGLKQWDKALPYAEAAASTWAEWAMLCAALCREGRGEWDAAETWVRNAAGRYPNSWWAWYLWCVRTGHGDAPAALRLAERSLAELPTRGLEVLPLNKALFWSIADEPRKALDELQKAPDWQANLFMNLFAADLADELGDEQVRDAALTRICEDPKVTAVKTVAVCKHLRDWLKAPAETKPNLAAIDELIGGMKNAPGNAAYFVGRFLARHGAPGDAPKYLKLAAEPMADNAYLVRILGISALRKNGIEPANISVQFLQP